MVEQLFHRTFRENPQARAYAPGRIEVIGNHTDYNGGCALGAAVDRGMSVAISARDDGECHFVSESMDLEVVAVWTTSSRSRIHLRRRTIHSG